jgi:prealbumin domain-containing protein
MFIFSRRGVSIAAAMVIAAQVFFVSGGAVGVFADDGVDAVVIAETAAPAEEPTPVEVAVISTETPPIESPLETVAETPSETSVVVPVEAVESATPFPDVQTTPTPDSVMSDPIASASVAAPTSDPTQQQTPAPTLTTDKDDYNPGETVTLFGRFFSVLEDLVIRIFGNSEVGDHHTDISASVTTDAEGSFTFSQVLDNFYRPLYDVIVTTTDGDELARTSFTDGPSASGDLDQCSNGPATSPAPCTGSAWQNGNLNNNQAHYLEGDSAPYRMVLSNVPTDGPNTLVIEYDVKHSGKHALDFLTSYDRTENSADPCSGISPCSADGPFAIPAPSAPTAGYFNALPIADREISIFNGTITDIEYVSEGDLNAAQSATRVKIEFTASDPTVVLAWGGHIGTGTDWGLGNSAGGISGSPYHMRFIELNGKGGNQDRSLSAGAIASARIIVDKVTVPAGDVQSFTFTPSYGSSFNLTDTATANTSDPLFAGTYSVSEGVIADWTQTSAICSDGSPVNAIALQAGETVTCTFTNTYVPPQAKLTVTKVVVNDNGGTKTIIDFPLFVDTTSVTSGVQNTFASGVYTISETSNTGYAAVISGDCAVDGSITLAPGDVKSCTITNNDIGGRIKIVKQAIGGDDTFNFAVAGPSASAPVVVTTGGAGDTGLIPVDAGDYSITETVPDGWTLTGSSCDSGTPAGFTVPLDTTVTCTFTNAKLGHIIIVKDAIANDAQDFTFNNDFGNGHSTTFQLDDDSTVALPKQRDFAVLPGTYVVSEDPVVGWQQESAVCSDGSSISAIDVAPGETVTCTFTNEKLATIVLVKNAVGGDGMFDFTMTGDGLPTGTQIETVGNTGSQTFLNLDPDNTYSIAETVPDGWTLTGSSCTGTNNTPASITPNAGEVITCTFTNTKVPKLTLVKTVVNNNGGTKLVSDFVLTIDGIAVTSGTAVATTVGVHIASESNLPGYRASVWGGDCAANGSITLAPGDEKICTITNDDVAPSLTLVKQVINDNGGIASVSDWTLIAADYDSESPDAGTYDLSESEGPDGYAQTSLTCSNSGDVQVTSVTLGLGEDVTCTFVNDDIAPKLHLRKVVVNDNGGTASVSAWTLTATGSVTNPTNLSGTTPVDSGSTFKADTYTLDESGPDGYASNGWSCSNQNNDGTIVVGLGEEVTCTITNDDVQPKLTLIKYVENNYGGLLDVADFPLNASGSAVISGIPLALNAGNYTASESQKFGYQASDWSGDCAPDGAITLVVGDNKTCEITNSDIQPKLNVIKHVINDNGGALDAGSFTMQVAGMSAAPDTFPGSESPGTEVFLDAGLYSIGEIAVNGYTASLSADCTGTIAIGETKTCTITNDDIAPRLTIIKHVINNEGNDAAASDFTMQVTGTSVSSASFPGSEVGVTITLDAGSYSVDEANDAGYVKTLSTDCVGTIAVGESKTCTITNDDKPQATRTQGFWQTHTDYTSSVFGEFSGPLQIGSKLIDTQGKLFGGFYSHLSKESNGKTKRSALNQARMQMLQQWLAAKLNCQAFGCNNATKTLLINAANAWGQPNPGVSTILSFASQLDIYNNSNDSLPIGVQGMATPQASQNLADKPFWDALP